MQGSEEQASLMMSGSSVGLKRCDGGTSSPSLCNDGDSNSAGLPRTQSACALRGRTSRKPLFWDQDTDSPSKRDL